MGGGSFGPPPPDNSGCSGTSAVHRRTPAAPDVDRGEEEQPDHVDEVPVPGRSLEAEMLPRREVALIDAHEIDDQEDRANQHVEAMEAGRHEEGAAIAATMLARR